MSSNTGRAKFLVQQQSIVSEDMRCKRGIFIDFLFKHKDEATLVCEVDLSANKHELKQN